MVAHPGDGDGVALQDLASRYRIADAFATVVLARSRPTVHGVLHATGPDVSPTALRGLAAWFERLCVDPDYRNPPPDEGMAALAALGASPGASPAGRVAAAGRAVRLARALSACRHAWSIGDPGDRMAALAELELAVEGTTSPQPASWRST
ncbi:MAG TPA: hypothetical protein VEI83_08840 [Acidimicrobiales bacterium]|nr:hypothetical protein [Acidimicrobiales bacterium]